MNSSHRFHEITIEDNILKISARGNWSKEQCQKFRDELLPRIDKQLAGKKWGCLVVLKNWFLTFDGIEVLSGNNEYALNRGMLCQAVVTQDAPAAGILDDMVLPKDDGIFQHRSFKTTDEATKWIQSRLN